MQVSKVQCQPEIVAAAFLILYMVLGSPFLYQVLNVTHVVLVLDRKANKAAAPLKETLPCVI